MCECIKTLAGMGYVQGNLLKQGQYWLYPITMNNKTQRQKVGNKPLLVKYCPECGGKLE